MLSAINNDNNENENSVGNVAGQVEIKNNQNEYETDREISKKKPKKTVKINKLKKQKSINFDANHSYINEIKASNVDELKIKRKNIIIIRQYLETFPEKLMKISGNNCQKFIKNLLTLSNEQLLCILEQIRCELSISRNSGIFNNIVEVSAI